MSASIPTWPKPHLSPEQREIAANLSNPDFSLTRLMQERRQRETNGDAERERVAAAEEAAKLAELEAQKLAEAEHRAKLEREAFIAARTAALQEKIEAARQKQEAERERWRKAQIDATIKSRPVSPGELAARARDIAAARKV